MKKYLRLFLLIAAGLILLMESSCGGLVTVTPVPAQKLASELTIYDWNEDIAPDVLEAFTKEYNVKVKYLTYASQEEAIQQVKDGKVFDVVVVGDEFLASLIKDNLIQKIDYQNIPNNKYIGPNFRDLRQDTGHQHSVPYNWGTTGLIFRSDLISQPVTSWINLWDQNKNGKVLLWKGLPRHMLGLTLKSLGYSANTENPAELDQALQKLIALKPNMVMAEDIDPNMVGSAAVLLNNQAVMAVGWNYDAITARKDNPAIKYVLPKEGALFWEDDFVIPTSSPNKYTAEVFLNFLLRPENSAKLTNYNQYPTPNEKAKDFIDPSILYDPIIYPSAQDIRYTESIEPLSAYGEKLYADTWKRFLAAP